jgi:hypothetical protein
MHRSFALYFLLVPLIAGCTPTIPVERDFGTSALSRSGPTAPEFAEFNDYDPSRNALVAAQLCATPYTEIDEKTIPAEPGQMAAWRARCNRYAPEFVP